jgi:hypothetical protein
MSESFDAAETLAMLSRMTAGIVAANPALGSSSCGMPVRIAIVSAYTSP